ncbi:hypothetical protein V9T40_000965 [Parthenolecanium corni]|uniref:Uncharacterized protein n=1 Tax=Parthenolecanium corni TaxID=536013 RepID=A0AAN9TRE5_9HEMI
MARAVQALLSLADEIEFEEYAVEEKRRRKEAASGKDISKDIFKTASDSLSNKEKNVDADSNNSCKHQ